MKIQLKHSNVLEGTEAKKPTSDQMEYGELAVNYNAGDPAIFLKANDNSIVRIAGVGSVGSQIDGYPNLDDGKGANLDARYVNVVGDNMTGDLTLGTDKVVLNATDGRVSFAEGKVQFNADGSGSVSDGKIVFNTNGSASFADGNLTFDVAGTVKTKGGVEFPDGTLQTTAAVGVPTGTVSMFAGSVAPAGWLECNGQGTGPYPELAAVVGANVPDMRGMFARGWDHGRDVDTGRPLGSFQDSANLSHNHTASDLGHQHVYAFRAQRDFTVNGNNNNNAGANLTSGTTNTGYANIVVNYSGDTESRPKNVALMYIIKT